MLQEILGGDCPALCVRVLETQIVFVMGGVRVLFIPRLTVEESDKSATDNLGLTLAGRLQHGKQRLFGDYGGRHGSIGSIGSRHVTSLR